MIDFSDNRIGSIENCQDDTIIVNYRDGSRIALEFLGEGWKIIQEQTEITGYSHACGYHN